MNEELILIIDDEEEIRDLIELYLLKHNYQVIQAGNGNAGLQLFRERQPSLVILDIGLPDMNGFEVCEEIRKLSDTPVIYLSCDQETETILRGFTLGADDFVTKPFDTHILIARIGAILRRRGGAAQLKKTLPDNVPGDLLTQREYNLLLLIEQGKTNKEIAKQLQLTEGTVKVYNNTLYTKLGAKSRVQAILQAKEWGLLP